MNEQTKTLLKRGFFNRCPSCGQGKLLRGYTSPNKSCRECNLDFEALRADDGPAWATILIAGHLSMPFVFWILEQGLDNTTIEISASIAVILTLSAIILPRAKGIFMAIIWLMHIKKEQTDDA
ncbi:MAG: DUF983 domain-containing protein [Alphaproteobacteria bacterium]